MWMLGLLATALILALPALAIAVTSRATGRTPVGADKVLAFCSWAFNMPIAMLLGAVLAGVFFR
jgi:hypothetical protein